MAFADGMASITMSTRHQFGALTACHLFYYFPTWRLLGAVTAFARRCHGVYCACVELSLTESNGVFLMKIDEKIYANLKNDKSKQNTI